MRKLNPLFILGIILTTCSLGYIVFYMLGFPDYFAFQKELKKGRLLMERGSTKSINSAMEIFSSMYTNYKRTQQKGEILFSIAECQEKLKKPKIALKEYKVLLKDIHKFPRELQNKIQFKIAKLQIMTLYKDEAFIRLLMLIRDTINREFRSEIYTELGHLYQAFGRFHKAKICYRIALREHSENQEAIRSLLKLMRKLGEPTYTLERFLTGKVNKWAPKKTSKPVKPVIQIPKPEFKPEPEPTKPVKTVEPVVKEAPGPSAKESLQDALTLYQNQDYYKAIPKFYDVSKKFSNTSEQEEAHFYMGNSYIQINKPNKAIESYKKVLQNSINIRDEVSLIKLGELYFDQIKYEQAIGYFAHLRDKYPDSEYFETAIEWENEILKLLADKQKYK